MATRVPRPSDRPYRSAARDELWALLGEAFAAADGAGGAHLIHELWMRNEFPQRIERALDRLWERAASTVPDWLPMRYVSFLPQLYDIAGRFQGRSKGRSNVYLVLLDFADRRGDPHGVYVGMSRYSPAQRFDQHKAGVRAAGSVLKRGIEVLTGPTLHLQQLSRADAARIEARLAAALQDAGIRVEGGR